MNLKSFLPKRKILSLDIGSYEIKAVEGKVTKSQIRIDNFFTIPMPKGAYVNGQIMDRDLIFYVMNEEINNRKLKTKDVYLNINSPSIITREIIIPKVEPEEIESVLSYQLEDYIPMNLDDYIVQFKTIGGFYEDEVEKLNILIIAIPKEMVKNHYDLLVDLGLSPLVLDYQPNSIAKLIKYTDYINYRYPTENITFATIDIGYDSTKVSIIKNGILQLSRVVEIGGKYIDQSVLNFYEYTCEELQQAKEGINDISHIDGEDLDYSRLVSIVKNAFDTLNEKIEIIFRYYFTREMDNKIHTILLYGGSSNIGGLPNLFSNYFDIPSIKVESLDNISFQGDMTKYINPIGSMIRSEV
ncbi:pilus assembly protein PilM [Clostridium sp. Cult3]|uniref:pilus assembly protein PilM n=1 Tax=Clostridium sp. Cult3 TaxID=2079004 RepID=UPI001F350C08|nr:pilus assembly protein PilM [Clostridium sp. Cult3]MCF6460072.1 hypothetical protein [Clostridium sp. Cult3]